MPEHVVLVGPHSNLGIELVSTFAKDGSKIAIVSRECDVQLPSSKKQQQLAKDLSSSGAEVSCFTGDLTKQKVWNKLSKEIEDFTKGKIDYLFYFDGIYSNTLFPDVNVSSTPSHIMTVNFKAPVFCFSVLMPFLKKSHGRIATFISHSYGRGESGSSMFTASKLALRSYIKNISTNNNGVSFSLIYPGVYDSIRLVKNKLIYDAENKLDDACVTSVIRAIKENQLEIILSDRKSKYCEEPYIIIDPLPLTPRSANDLCKEIFSANIVGVKDMMKQFKTNPDMLLHKDEYGRNSLHYCARVGCLQIFELIICKIRKKTLLNTPDNFKWTPLHIAAYYGNLRMTKRLIREGADANCLTPEGASILHFLARFQPPSDSQKCVQQFTQALKLCVDVGVDTNQRSNDWYTPVHAAAFYGSQTALEVFLKYEGDPHRKTKNHSRTPLGYAVKNSHKNVIQTLLDAGADPIDCFEFANEDIIPLLEKFRETNCRPESVGDDHKRQIIIIKSMDDFPSSAKKLIEGSGLLETKRELIDENWNSFLYILRFLTRKIYRTPEEFAENPNPEPKRAICSRTLHKKSIEEATQALVTPGNPRKMFKIIEDVGRGGFGSVVMVKRMEDKRQVAIKKVPHLTEKEQWSNLDEIYFLQECKHSCVVKYYNAYLSRDEMWMVMEFMEGGSLQVAVSKFKLEEEQICYVTKEILRGLRHMHSKNMVHRDLKSANIMLSIHGDIKIIDFGLCVEMGAVETENMVGSPFWIPPEMIRKEQHGPPADIWSLAILCLEMAYGKPPHRSSALKAMFYLASGIPPSLGEGEKWSDEFKDFLSCMLKLDPKERHTAEQLLKHPWMEQAADRKAMAEILHHIFVEKSLERSLGIQV